MRRVVLDCDPGHDDALAILLAAKHLDVLGITTVGGNQLLEKVTINALKVLEVTGMTHIPVYPGHTRPMVGDLVTAHSFMEKAAWTAQSYLIRQSNHKASMLWIS